MKLSYRKYPILKYADKRFVLHNKTMNEELLNSEHPKTDEDKYVYLIQKAILNGILTDKPIFLLADSFLDAVNRNIDKLSTLSKTHLSDVEENCIFVGPRGNIFVSHVYDKGKIFIIWMNPYGEIVSLSHIDNNLHSFRPLVEMDHGDSEQSSLETMYIILFKKFASVELELVEAGTKKKSAIADKGKVINELGVDVTLLDCRWFREIIRNEGFKVSGHFRLQPCKDENGEWKRKLIYIKDFEKHGYHRRAQISIENEDIDN